MTKAELVEALVKARKIGEGEGPRSTKGWAPVGGDPEQAHAIADDALLEFIGDDDIRYAFDRVPKWYA